MSSVNDYFYDQYGNLTYEGDNDYNGARLKTTAITLNSQLCSSKDICNHPASVLIQDGGSNQKALTNYTYDANGNATEISKWVSGGSYLNQYYSYNANGTVNTATDPNGTATTYSYAGNSCNNAFPTSITAPSEFIGSLTTTYAYNCTGGVQTLVTDPNGAITSTSYTDAYFWRPASTTDALGNITHYSYYPALGSVGQIESAMSLNWYEATVDTLTTPDTYGRPWLQQRRQAANSGNFDTVQYWYDTSGRVLWLARPFQAQAGQYSGGGIPATGYTYDAMGRYTDITDWSGIHTDYSYSLNDVKVTVSPAPAGENTKSRQYEYDAMGRLASVCEVTSGSGSGACTQHTAATGYSTSYTYDPLGNITYMTQNGQYRSFAYDGLSRLNQEYNPEISNLNGTNQNAGIVKYTYDTDSTCGSYAGDEVKRVDPAGNVTCYAHDGLHRLTGITYPGGNTQYKGYIYDMAAPLGFSQANPKGRMVVAYTGSGVNWTGWDAFGYDANGNTTDFYTIAPNSPAYHVYQTYFANGEPSSLQGFIGTGTTTPFSHAFGYAVDGEGRLFGMWDGTSGNVPWPSTAYNVASQPTQVNLISGAGAESFNYDGNSGRMTQWSSTVGSYTQTGYLTWNANTTLQKLQIADNANPGNAQTCTYAYDDLARVVNDLCGSVWNEYYGYDPQGNIWKAGAVTFQNGYNGLNHVLGFTYDNDGNVTNDQVNTYSNDAEGRPTTENGVQIYYDAFGRAEVQNNSGVYRQIIYSPTGEKFAFMNGSTLQQYMVPMVAGMIAVYLPNGLHHFRHVDWLGSARFDSTPSGTVWFDGAYGPFGEQYAGSGTSARDFTGQTSDTVGTNYDFLFRQYSYNQGLWLTPDPAGSAAVDITNPQTWNRYAYVGNSPLSNVDPLGLDPCSTNPNQTDCPQFAPGWGYLAFLGWPGQNIGEFWCFFSGGCSSSPSTSSGGDGNTRVTYPPITITVDGGDAPQVPLITSNLPNVIHGIWQVRKRPLKGFPRLPHYYLYDEATGESVGLGTTNAAKACTGQTTSGEWETSEPAGGGTFVGYVPSWANSCVSDYIDNRGDAPNYCAYTGGLADPNATCLNCKGWVSTVLSTCESSRDWP